MTQGANTGAPRVGVVGGGQLARMMVQAAMPMGIAVTVMDPDPLCPAVQVGATALDGAADDRDALFALAARTDVITFDHEHVPIELVRELEAAGIVVGPGSTVAQMASDKSVARVHLQAAGYGVPDFAVVHDAAGVIEFATTPEPRWPVVVKAATGGYDGRGVMIVRSEEDAAEAAASMGDRLVVEEFVPFDSELAVLVARSTTGETVAYSPVTTVQSDGMCVEVICPAQVDEAVLVAAEELGMSLATELGLVGVMAVELFLVEGRLIVNELATRPHNTAHHTIEAAETSQFEQHLRAVLGWPLGSTALRSPAAVMRNVTGPADGSDPVVRVPQALGVDKAHVHLYGKQSRPGRKLGHVTALGRTVDEARSAAGTAADFLNGVTHE